MASVEKKSEQTSPDRLSDSDVEAHSHIKTSALLRKLDFKLLPAVGVLYLLSFLDRSNVANARLDGLTTDLHMTGNQYLTSLTLFFIGYVLFEVPWNVALKRTTPKIWLPTITLVWGIIATLMGVSQNLAGFFVVRFFLGATEGGLFPGVVFYLSMWYKRAERQFRVSLFFSAASLAGAFGGILAYGIGFMKGVGGYNGWRWIFIIEGLVTVVVSLAAYYFIANYPNEANFLREDERAFIHERLKADSDATNNEGFTWANVGAALKDPKCWLYGLVYHSLSLPLYTLSLFLPTIIKSLGYTAANAQLLTVPPYALAFILTASIAIISERVHIRAPFIISSSLFAAIGYCILLSQTDPTHNPGVSYLGTFFAAGGIYPAVALSLSWPAMNVSGQTKRATANAMQISIGNLGAVIGTQLYRSEDGPTYVLGHSFALGYLLANCIIVGLLWLILARENRRRDQVESEGPVTDETEWHGDDDLRWRFST
ncbi:MFS general substrate transporter [Viridothelium virens]|uniref:MFS general substrate transporter n=1 Tax=Viridothelium virens TaxID=1048519 RepID=A0A6A6H4L8_VIRVR|nr:MFS general substrate transporter [Viridothelium virens]